MGPQVSQRLCAAIYANKGLLEKEHPDRLRVNTGGPAHQRSLIEYLIEKNGKEFLTLTEDQARKHNEYTRVPGLSQRYFFIEGILNAPALTTCCNGEHGVVDHVVKEGPVWSFDLP